MWNPWIMGINGTWLTPLKTTLIVKKVTFSARCCPRWGDRGRPQRLAWGDGTCSGQLAPQAPDLHHGLVPKPVGLAELGGAARVLAGSHSTCG